MADITYRLSAQKNGRRIEWKAQDNGVRVLFLKDGDSLIASSVVFKGEQFSKELAERWMANRVAQYCLNSQIDSLNKYESTLLAALIDFNPKYKAIARTWKETPAIKRVGILNQNDPIWETSRQLRKKVLESGRR